ncbi:LOW QUALITY PROTEIN: hypothetical protein U9M48_027925 [Paspalum notatum var. saurae]|uniref:CCHC-type domain-containing protein n=1 Tax=Paspalum notatum var. saurae TaxID=547442 RepID=A0AAQ3TY57_PASNO
MEAFLVSQSQDIWDATQSTTFVVLLVAEDIAARHEANAKAVNFLFFGLGPMDYERVSHLQTAREIWSLLSAHHEGAVTIKARLVETYRREYENFVQKPGESVDDLFVIINKLRVNSAPAELPYTDHQQAVKLLYALDRKVWEIKVNSIIESAGYDTIGVEALYSKLKATEVDFKLRDSLACTGSKSLALATPTSESVANPLMHNFSFSALMSVTEEQLASLGDEELCLVSSRFQRAYDNRMSKKRGERPKCFECGETSHFIAECPNKNDYYKKGKSYSRDSDKYHSGKPSYDKHDPASTALASVPLNFRKAFKSYQKNNRKRDKAFFAEIGFCSSGSSSSSSSSSSSDEEITHRKDKRNDQGGPAGLCFVSTKSRRKNKDKRSSVCSMALEDKENKDDGSNSSSDDEDRGMEDVWIMDSGCSRHMTGHGKWFSNLNPMSREFEMSLMGELQFFLGLQIKQGPEGTFVHQAKYTRDILKKFEMGDSKPMTTPMSTNTALDADEDGEAVHQKEFRGMIGSLLYLTGPGRTFSSRSAFVRVTRLLLGLLTVKQLQVEGVDNALIKGKIESQWTSLIALLV